MYNFVRFVLQQMLVFGINIQQSPMYIVFSQDSSLFRRLFFFTHPVICVKEVNTRKTCTLNKSSMITTSSQTQNSRDRKLTTENRYCTAQYRQQYDSKININKNEVSVSLIDFHIPGITCIRFMKIKIFNVIKLTLSYIFSYK